MKCGFGDCLNPCVPGVRLCWEHWRHSLPQLIEGARESERRRVDAGEGLHEEPILAVDEYMEQERP